MDSHHRLTIDSTMLAHVNTALADIRAGKMVILVDDEDRENEGDLCMAAELVTPEAINFMATHGRGLICLALAEEQVERLELPLMTTPGRKGPPLGTAFTVSIEAAEGVTTGISAADRAQTIKVATAPNAIPQDVVSPGHIFPLKARCGGVLVRTGQTEGAVDLARMAGLRPAGVICEIMKTDGTMARMPDLEQFGKDHGLCILTIAELIQYRLQTETLVRRLEERDIRLDATKSTWRAIVYGNDVETRQVLALVKGEINSSQPTLCRVHSGSMVADLFSATLSEGGANLREALARIEEEGQGVLLYLDTQQPLSSQLARLGVPAAPDSQAAMDSQRTPSNTVRQKREREQRTLRKFGLGAQVLADLGIRELRLLTNNPRKIAGLKGYGLKVVERIPLTSMKDE